MIAKKITLDGYLAVLLLATLALRAVLCTYYHNNLGGIEPNVVYGIQRLLLGQHLYQPTDSGMYAVMQYTPVWYYTVAALAKGLGFSGYDVQGIYQLCRITALVCNLFTIAALASIIRPWCSSYLQAFLRASPILLVLTTHYYTRGDSMHLLWFALATVAYLRYARTASIWLLLLAAACTALCIMTKQSGILIAGIIGWCLLVVQRKPWAAMAFAADVAIGCYLVAVACSGNNWAAFHQNAYLGLKNGIDASFLIQIFTSQFFLDLVPCYVLGGIVGWYAVHKITDIRYRILATGAVASFVFAVVTGLKIGSSNNYFTEFLFFVIAGIWPLLQYLNAKYGIEKPTWKQLARPAKFAYIALFILVTSKTLGFATAVCIDKSIKSTPDEYRREQQLLQWFITEKGLLKSEHIFFTERRFLDNLFIDYALLPNKDVASQVYLTDTATYNYQAFIAGMNTGLVRYIVTDETNNSINQCRGSLPFVSFDTTRFQLQEKILGFAVYVYNPAH